MKIVFYGGRQTGVIALLTLLALDHKVVCVVPVDKPVERVAKSLKMTIKKPKDINQKSFVNYLKSLKPDLFVCCHGRQILKKDILTIPAINLHPCLYKYPGANPVGKMLKEGNKRASVACHWMTEKVDRGKVIVEKFLEVQGLSVVEVYNELYPLYSEVLIAALEKIKQRKNDVFLPNIY